MANRISVVVGFSETMRDGAALSRIVSPKSSSPKLCWWSVVCGLWLHATNHKPLTTNHKRMERKRHLQDRGSARVHAKARECHWILPRGTKSWRERRSSPGSGPLARLPDRDGQWLCERKYRYPLQWRGRTGITPVSVSPTRV